MMWTALIAIQYLILTLPDVEKNIKKNTSSEAEKTELVLANIAWD